MSDIQPLNLFDFERVAEAKLLKAVFDYYAGGAFDEVALRASRAAYEHIPLYFHALVGVAERNTATTVLGEKVSMPVLIAPTAFHRLAHADGELATARAAGKARTLMIVSTLSNTAVEDIAATATGPLWFQLYIYKDRNATRDLVARVEAAGCRAIVLTVDAPILGPRERDVRNRFALPSHLSVQNLVAAGQGTVAGEESGSGLATYINTFIDPSISWRDVEWLRSITKLPVIIKGIVRADDARRAVEAGARAIVVSNHGGRQLDALPATIDALPYVAEAVNGRAEVYVDGGIRRGLDVVKAIARGARAVLIGRPVLWGLAANGEHGVARVLDMLQREIDNTMGLCGCPAVDHINADLLRPDASTR
ncbi:MAG TPA: alpha-hydroxy acid oxidase [Candidatus Krumholzibacteria bacterium]|nr:alpha-hydroxy acid oxidase [Candidatus Krumholzibacteria bacterium]